MTYVLDAPFHLGAGCVACVSQVSITSHRMCIGAGLTGSKQPTYILCAQGGAISAFDPGGAAVALTEVDACCPGAVATFGRHAASQSN